MFAPAFNEFRSLKKRYWGQHLWGVLGGHLVAVTDEMWKEYIKNQQPPEPDDDFDVCGSKPINPAFSRNPKLPALAASGPGA